MSQIRLNKTPELEEVLACLRTKYRLLSEAEIIKVALAEKYAKEVRLPFALDTFFSCTSSGMIPYLEGPKTALCSPIMKRRK